MAATMFRMILQVGDLDRAMDLYSKLLETGGRKVGGGRAYFDCGAMILALVQAEGDPTPLPENVYFAVAELEAFHARAKELDMLSADEVHGESAGEIIERPWGERSFYARDPWGNGLCLVDEQTIFTGRRAP